jgi:hypothetical protein
MSMDSALASHFDRELGTLQAKAESLLAKPPHVSIDPQSATINGVFLPAAIDATLKTLFSAGVTLTRPKRLPWNTSDLGGGISRDQLRELAADVADLRQALAHRGYRITPNHMRNFTIEKVSDENHDRGERFWIHFVEDERTQQAGYIRSTKDANEAEAREFLAAVGFSETEIESMLAYGRSNFKG